LAQFAVRPSLLATTWATHAVRSLTVGSGATVTVPYSAPSGDAFVPGQRHAVVACWRRYQNLGLDTDVPEGPIPNIDLEVWTPAPSNLRLASSTSAANAYDRATFVVPDGLVGLTSVEVRITRVGPDFPNESVTVQIAARRLVDDLDPYAEDPVHSGTGTVLSLDPAQGCAGSPPSRNLDGVGVVPTTYEAAYGSFAFARQAIGGYPTSPPPVGPPGFGALNLAEMIAVNPPPVPGAPLPLLHFEITGTNSLSGSPPPTVMSPMVIGGLAFRTWRPFAIDGELRINEIFMASTGSNTAVAQSAGSLGLQPSGLPNLIAAAAPVVLVDPGPNWSELRFDRFAVVVPFTQDFSHTGGNLHVWIRFDRATSATYFQVDSVADADSASSYGITYPDPNVPPGPPNYGSRTFLGTVPVIGFLPPVALMSQVPRIDVHGEPRVGQGFDVHLSRTPASVATLLAIGTWQTAGLPCMLHLAAPYAWQAATTNYAGFARFNVSLPLSASAIHSELGFQAAFDLGSGLILSNGLCIRAGGSR
jgi:hypothetical protein